MTEMTEEALEITDGWRMDWKKDARRQHVYAAIFQARKWRDRRQMAAVVGANILAMWSPIIAYFLAKWAGMAEPTYVGLIALLCSPLTLVALQRLASFAR